MFRHGRADDPEYVHSVCEEYHEFYLSTSGLIEGSNFEVLEFGCGDSVSAGIYFSSRGASRTHLIDIKSFAVKHLKVYRKFCTLLGVDATFKNFDDLLHKFSINYLVDGVSSLSTLTDKSIDLAYSHSVLQHLTERDLDQFIEKLYEKLKVNAVTRHRIDLRNMYDQSTTHHHVPDFLWNSSFFTKLPFYSNRVSIEDYMAKFESAGFQLIKINKIDKVKIVDVNDQKTLCQLIAFDIELRKT